MTEEEEKERGFKVADRRRFSAEGEAKPGAAEEKPAPEPVKPAPPHHAHPPEDAPRLQGGPSAGAQADASAAYQRAASSQPGGENLGPQDLNFASFIVGLSTEALALLGEIPHPATGEHIRDLVGAQQIIDILGILREKTRGNLSHDEDVLVDAILFDLRMKYVEKMRQSPR
jgi:hypothetical protein